MATRGTLKIYDRFKRNLANLYIHYDSYPEGWPTDIKEYIKSGKMVNGISLNEKNLIFNGFEDLGAQLIHRLKKGQTGGVYLTNEEDYQEYNYLLIENEDDSITFSCVEEDDEDYKEYEINFTETFFKKDK